MYSPRVLVFALGLVATNVMAFPTIDVLESRDTISADTVNSYITQVMQAGFVPNAKPTNAKRSENDTLDLVTLMERATSAPNINLVLNLLKQHGFQPAAPTNTKPKGSLRTRDDEHVSDMDDALDELPSSLSKRTLPDINLVISLLKKQGFVPTGKKTRSLEARQDPNDVNTVINQLMAAGYNPNDFGPQAQAWAKQMALPTTLTAKCPNDNNTLYNAAGISFVVNCNWDYSDNDLTLKTASSLADCIKQCANYKGTNGKPCVAAVYGGGSSSGLIGGLFGGLLGNSCFLKSGVSGGNHRSKGMSAGRNIAFGY